MIVSSQVRQHCVRAASSHLSQTMVTTEGPLIILPGAREWSGFAQLSANPLQLTTDGRLNEPVEADVFNGHLWFSNGVPERPLMANIRCLGLALTQVAAGGSALVIRAGCYWSISIRLPSASLPVDHERSCPSQLGRPLLVGAGPVKASGCPDPRGPDRVDDRQPA